MEKSKTVQPFSAGYFMIDAETEPINRDTAVVARDYFDELTNYVTYPLLRMGQSHLWARPEHGVPADTVAAPESALPASEESPVLLAKDETAYRLITAGEQARPA